MHGSNGNDITDDFVSSIRFVEHAWEKQEQRLLNIKAFRFWVPDMVGDLYDKFKIADPDFAAEFALKWKRGWWYLKGFVRKSDAEKLEEMEKKGKRIGQIDYLDFGKIGGKDLGARFELVPLKIDEGKFGIICFDLFPISERIKLMIDGRMRFK